MMKFTMNAKELKTMMEKGIAAIDKKSALASLTRLYLQSGQAVIIISAPFSFAFFITALLLFSACAGLSTLTYPPQHSLRIA